jgi:hypothetical protein
LAAEGGVTTASARVDDLSHFATTTDNVLTQMAVSKRDA